MSSLIDEILRFSEEHPNMMKVTREELDGAPILDIRGMEEGERRSAGFMHVRKENGKLYLWADFNDSPDAREGYLCGNFNEEYDQATVMVPNDKGGSFMATVVRQAGSRSHV